MTHLITGVAGFIGSNLASRLLSQSIKVIGIDNFHLGSDENIKNLHNDPNFEFLNYDISSIEGLSELKAILQDKEISYVWHLAANSDIQAGVNDSSVDLKLTFLTSYVSLELCKDLSIPNFIMASSSAIYGDLPEKLSELTSPLVPISNYGAMKLASEAMIGASLEQGVKKSFVFRFPNVVGTPATHGVIYDFVKKLKQDPELLEVLGNGTQKKCYMHVSELISAMLHCTKTIKSDGHHCFNVGPTDTGITVKEIAERVVRRVSPNAKIVFGSGNKGWVGDIPSFEFDVSKMSQSGWSPSLNSHQAVDLAISQITENLT